MDPSVDLSSLLNMAIFMMSRIETSREKNSDILYIIGGNWKHQWNIVTFDLHITGVKVHHFISHLKGLTFFFNSFSL